METARFFGEEAVAQCERLTVRKLYNREYHFFDGDKGACVWGVLCAVV